MLYDLSREIDRERLQHRVKTLVGKGAGLVDLTLKEERTRSQNAYLHLLIGYFAMETGYTAEWVKRECFKRGANAALFVTERDGVLGRVEDLRGTAELTKEEMSLAIDRFRDWAAAEADIYLPEANESAFLREIEVELNRSARYL